MRSGLDPGRTSLDFRRQLHFHPIQIGDERGYPTVIKIPIGKFPAIAQRRRMYAHSLAHAVVQCRIFRRKGLVCSEIPIPSDSVDSEHNFEPAIFIRIKLAAHSSQFPRIAEERRFPQACSHNGSQICSSIDSYSTVTEIESNLQGITPQISSFFALGRSVLSTALMFDQQG